MALQSENPMAAKTIDDGITYDSESVQIDGSQGIPVIPKIGKEDETSSHNSQSFENKTADDDSVYINDCSGPELKLKQEKVCKHQVLHFCIWRCVRIATQVFLCLAIFVCIIVSKASFQFIAMVIGNRDKQLFTTDRKYLFIHDILVYQLTGCLMLPDIMKLLKSLFRIIFKSTKHNQNSTKTDLAKTRLSSKVPKNGSCSWMKLHLIKHVFIEFLQCISMYTFVFTCLPALIPTEFCAVVAGLPLIISMITTVTLCVKSNVMRKTNLLTIFFCGSQTVCFIAMLLFISYKFYLKYHTGQSVIMTALSIVLMGLLYLHESKEKELNRCYNVTNVISSCIRMIVPVILIQVHFTDILSVSSLIFSIKDSFQNQTSTWIKQSDVKDFPLMTNSLYNLVIFQSPYIYFLPLIHLLSSFLSYHFAIIACRTRMQRTSFALPLSIAMPFYTLVFFINDLGLFHDNFNNIFGLHPDIQQNVLMFGIFVGLWISQLWTCRSIWENQKIVMTDTNKLFDSHSYCGPFIDIILLHSRKNFEREFEQFPIKEEAKSLLDDSRRQSNEYDIKPMVYVCATMWHETLDEMKMLLTSILGLDYDHASQKTGTPKTTKNNDDKFDFEAHIFFDDAFKVAESHEKILNEFVAQFQCALKEAVEEYYKSNTVLTRYSEQITPYGYRKTWILPCENSLTVHFKDKELVRNKKRWSQVMYFNYILKHRLSENFALSDMEHEQVKNTYILVLDGDVTFSPLSVKQFLRKIKDNQQIAATTGRLIPCGSGPIIWYQKFEYAVSHWMWKTAEHVFGSVLCAPGCFSLYRASALLTGDILEKFAAIPASPREVLQFDQGEDRWLCTLLLQKGFRIDYVLDSSAETVAPETLSEFLRQRRRWMSSFVVNNLDLIKCAKVLRKQNSDITLLYIMLLCLVTILTALTPYAILWGIEISLIYTKYLDHWLIYNMTYGPCIIHFLICFFCKSRDLQHKTTQIFTLIYVCIIIFVGVGQVADFKDKGFSLMLLLYFMPYILAGVLHISQVHNLFYFFTFYILSPMGYILTYTYTICNLNDISWGTREIKSASEQNTSAKHNPPRNNSNMSSLIKSITSLIKCKHTETIQKRKLDTTCKAVSPEDDYNSETASINEIYPDSRDFDQEKVFWHTLICKCLKPIHIDENTKPTVLINLQKYKTKWLSIYIAVNCGLFILRKLLDIFRNTLDIEVFSFAFTPIGIILLVVAFIMTLVQIIGLFVYKYKVFLNKVSNIKIPTNNKEICITCKFLQRMHK